MNEENKQYHTIGKKFWIFIIGLTIVKCIIAGFFSSDYQDIMFIPFVESFVKNHENPYQYYYNNHLLSSFPYPTIMLLIESIGWILKHLFAGNSVFLSNLLFKLPLCFFDLLCMFMLIKLYPKQRKRLALIYYTSPIILYSVYMHGQLDIIPIAFLMVSIYCLVQNRKKMDYAFVFFLAASIMTKQHILAVVPILLMDYYKKRSVKESILITCLLGILTLGFALPFWGEGFVGIVLFNREQTAITDVFLSYSDIKLYIPVLAVILIFLKVMCLRNMNKDLLLSFCGITFFVFLAFVSPMPGWFVWIVPFSCIIFSNSQLIQRSTYYISYYIFHLTYLIYFIVFHKTEFVDLSFLGMPLSDLKIENSTLTNLSFTVLAGLMFFLIYVMYHVGINSNSLYKRRSLPFTIGISGDSASGKSTLIDIISDFLGTKDLLFIEGDGDHRWERGEEEWKQFTHLNPKANYLYRQAQDVSELRRGQSVLRTQYDHDTGKFTQQQLIKPNRYIVVCGLHSLYLPQMRDNLDLKIYMDTEEDLRKYWKTTRDTSKRGYSMTNTIKQIEERMPDYQQYILPQKQYADLVITYFDPAIGQHISDSDYQPVISLRLTMSSAVNLERLTPELLKYQIDMNYEFSETLNQQTIVFEGDSLEQKEIPFYEIAVEVVDQLDEIVTERLKNSDMREGIIQLFILILISKKMKGEL
ncbi:MAG: uridine kinase [Clostridia bacterium]|nr:uridine kinase [Clostridia bacterium]